MADFDLLWRATIDASDAVKGSDDYLRAQQRVTSAATDAAQRVSAAGKSAGTGAMEVAKAWEGAAAAAGASSKGVMEAGQAAGGAMDAVRGAAERVATELEKPMGAGLSAVPQHAAAAANAMGALENQAKEAGDAERHAAEEAAAGMRKLEAAREREHAAMVKDLADVRERITVSARLRGEIAGVARSTQEQAQMLGQLTSRAKTDRETLHDLFIDGKLGAAEFRAQLDPIEREMAQLATQARGLGGAFGGGFKAQLGGISSDLLGVASSGSAASSALAGIAGGLAGGAVMAGLSAVGTGVRAVGHALADSIHAIADSEAEHRRLAQSLNLVGQSLALPKLDDFARSMAGATTYTDEAVSAIEQFGVSMNVPIGQLPRFSMAAADLASALHVDLSQAARQLAQTLDGDIGRLGQMVPALTGLTAAQLKAGEGIDLVGEKFRGMAVGDADTLKGALGDVTKQFGELQEAFGAGVTASGAFEKATRGVADSLRGLRPDAEAAGEAISSMFLGNGAISDSNTAKVLRYAEALYTLGISEQFRAVAGRLQSRRESGEAARTAEEGLAERGGGVLGGLQDRQRSAIEQAEHAERIRRNEQLDAKIKGLVEGIEQQADAEKRLADAATDAETEKKKALELQIRGIEDRAFATQHVIEETGRVTSSLDEQETAYGKLRSQGEADLGTLNDLWISGAMAPKHAKEEILLVKNALEEVKAASDKISLDRFMGKRLKAMQAGGPDEPQTRDAPLGQDKAAEATAHEVVAEAATRERVALAALTMQLGDLGLAREQQAIAQAEAALQTDIETGAIDALTAAGGREIAMRMQAIGAMEKEAAQHKAAAAQANLTKNAKLQQNMAEIGGALASVEAVTKSTKAKMAIQAAQNVVEGITEAAKSYAAYAAGNPVAGTAHAISSATFFYAASQAGHGGGGGGGGGDAGGGERASESAGGRDSTALGGAEPAAPLPPTVHVQVLGPVVGGTRDELGRSLTDVVGTAIAESGYRQPTPRSGGP